MLSRRSLKLKPQKLLLLAGLCLCVAFLYRSCQGKVPPAPDIPGIKSTSPGAYRTDEQIRLKLLTQDILELEKARDYDKIYERYGSRWFKRRVSRRDYLRMANCVERTVGGLVEYDQNAGLYSRKITPKHVYDTVVFPVIRSGGNLKEHLTYVLEGVDFKLNAIYWSTTRKDVLSCVETVLKGETETSSPEGDSEQPSAGIVTTPAPKEPKAAAPTPEKPSEPTKTETELAPAKTDKPSETAPKQTETSPEGSDD